MNYKTKVLDDYETLHRRCLLEHGFGKSGALLLG